MLFCAKDAELMLLKVSDLWAFKEVFDRFVNVTQAAFAKLVVRHPLVIRDLPPTDWVID